jgi:hypothetical protein
MTLGRLEVRQRVRDRLLGATAAGARVYSTRKRTLWESGLPAIAVYGVEETEPSLLSSSEPLIWKRELVVGIDLHVSEKDGVPDDQVDLICQEIEQAIFGGERLLGLERVLDLIHAGVQFRYDGRGQKLEGSARVLLRIPYQFQLEVEPASIAPWVRFATDWDLAPPDGTPEAVDLQTLDQ